MPSVGRAPDVRAFAAVGTRHACQQWVGVVMGGDGLDIGELRKRLDMTQEQFARELGVTVGTVNRWENGHFRPSPLAEREIRKLTARVQRRKKRAENEIDER